MNREHMLNVNQGRIDYLKESEGRLDQYFKDSESRLNKYVKEANARSDAYITSLNKTMAVLVFLMISVIGGLIYIGCV